jgi:hypothetical protein
VFAERESQSHQPEESERLLWTVDFSLPQAGSPVLPGAPRYINAVRDNGIFFAGVARDQQTFDNYLIPYTISGGAVPEPASWAMMIGGFGMLGAATTRARKPSVVFG